MKKFILIIIIAMCLSLVGCENTTTDNEETDFGRFVVIKEKAKGFDECKILIDKETNVMYLFVDGYNSAGLTVMLDADGKPLIWDGE